MVRTTGHDEKLLAAVERLHESNPMLGLRGVRLGLTDPGPVRDAGAGGRRGGGGRGSTAGGDPRVEIMVPLVGSVMELHLIRDEADKVLAEVAAQRGVRLDIPIGTMIELPRAALTARPDRRGRRLLLLRHQRPHPDRLGVLPRRRRGRILRRVPRQGRVHGVAVRDPRRRSASAGSSASPSRKAAAARPGLKIGVCGEHGGDPESVHFFHEVGLDYVSCSPFRVPVARLEAGRAAITFEESGEGLAAPR